MRGYQIVDEPVPTRLGHLMTSPFWILLATMLGGTWLGWPWFVLNSLAIGSMHRRREIAAVVLGLVGSMALGAALFVAAERAYLDATSAPYTVTVLVVWKMLIAYLLLAWQTPSFELAVHFGRAARNGMLIAFAAMFLRSKVLGLLPVYWQLVLS